MMSGGAEQGWWGLRGGGVPVRQLRSIGALIGQEEAARFGHVPRHLDVHSNEACAFISKAIGSSRGNRKGKAWSPKMWPLPGQSSPCSGSMVTNILPRS